MNELAPGVKPVNVLHTMNVAGNVHQTASMINERLPELVDYVVHIEYSADYSVVLFRAPLHTINDLKAEKRI
jgi:hypothetical protein